MDDKIRTQERIEYELEVARMIYEGGPVHEMDPKPEGDGDLSLQKHQG